MSTDIVAPGAAPLSRPPKGRSLWDDARRRLARNKAAVASLWTLGFMVLLAAIGAFNAAAPGVLPLRAVDAIFRESVAAPPGAEFLLGTDSEGRDMLARILFGLSVSLAVGVVATLVSLAIGVLWGAAAGFVGGPVDTFMMRVVDVLYTVPFIFFVILLTVTFGSNPILIFVAIGAVEWLTMARIVRGQTIALRRKEFMEAARASGATMPQIILRHVVPNVLGPVIVFATLNIPVVILAESFLSFLGLGIQEPLTSLGALISDGAREIDENWWMLVFPAAAMFITLLCLNFLGDGLQDALDPKDR